MAIPITAVADKDYDPEPSKDFDQMIRSCEKHGDNKDKWEEKYGDDPDFDRDHERACDQ